MHKTKDIYFSIVIPAHNEEEMVMLCIESVLAQENDIGYEIIFVDNCSTDNTVEMAKAFGVTVMENTAGTIGAVRNAGATRAQGKTLVFLDCDMIVPSDWLKKAKVWFDGGFSGALGFTFSVPNDAGWVAKTWGSRIHQKVGHVTEAGYLPGCNIFINRTLFEEIGGFDELMKTNEDKDLTIRVKMAGHRVISISETQLFHLGHEKSLLDFIKKEFWRQGSSLIAARRSGLTLRNLRSPLVSLWHFIFLAVLPFSLPFLLQEGEYALAFILLAAWLSPSIAITKIKLGSAMPGLFFSRFFVLTFIRWNVSGVSLMNQLIRFFPIPQKNGAAKKTSTKELQ